MTEIHDNISLVKFLKRIFISESGVSSKRVSAFILLAVVIILMFLKYDIEYVNSTMLLIAMLFGLTSGEKIFKKSDPGENKG